jgi:hypothetical protein
VEGCSEGRASLPDSILPFAAVLGNDCDPPPTAINVCKSCHTAIHDLIPDEKKLGRSHNTRETLLANPKIAGYIEWKRERSQ